MRRVGIAVAALFGVALLAYTVGLGIYAFASTGPNYSTQPRSVAEARRVVERLNLDSVYPFEPRFLLTPHGRMHFVDEGQGGTRTVLCLHGAGTWSLDCAGLVSSLRKETRVVAPDLIGFGLSEKPALQPDDPVASHTSDLVVLLEILDLRGVEVVAAYSSTPIAVELARRAPDRVRSTFIHEDAASGGRLVFLLARAPVLGEVLVQGLGALSPGLARSPSGRLQANWDERASSLALARAVGP